MAARQFGTELSGNVSSLAPAGVTTSNPLKRPLPKFYKDRSAVDNKLSGKKARTLADFNFHFRDQGYQVPPQRKRVEYSRSRRVKIDVITDIVLRVPQDSGEEGPAPSSSKTKISSYQEDI